MGNSRRQAIEEAFKTNKEIIIWIEPEKYTFIKEIKKCVESIINHEADMVIPKRKSLATYPLAQQYVEPFANLMWKDVTGLDLDIWSGFKVFKRTLSKYFLDYNGEYGDKWESIVIPVIDAIANGERVVGVEIDYVHPIEQTKSEEGNFDFHRKRIEQLNNFLKIEEHWKKCMDNKKK